MKKHYFLICSLLCIGIVTAQAQLTDIVNFDNGSAPMGKNPRGSVTISGNTVYGLTSAGGANMVGCIFSVNTNGTGYTDLHDFTGATGQRPNGSLILSASGTSLYGMASQGGAHGFGCIFKINSDGSGYADKYDFDSVHGKAPTGSLVLSGAVLYGMTPSGGANDSGVIFSVDTNGTGYADIHDFDGPHGRSPSGSVIISGTVLYGFTGAGGANEHGTIFSINTNGTGFADIHDFDGVHGQLSQGDPLLIGSVLYGLGTSGGANGDGCLFSINTNGTGFTDLHDFTMATGQFPYCTLIQSGTLFYGVTQIGGANVDGVIFSVNIDGTGYTDLYDFDITHGQNPLTTGSLAISGNMLYGTTFQGGTNNDGVVFSFGVTALGVDNLMNNEGIINVYPNPSSGVFNIVVRDKEQGINEMEVYNILGEKVYSNYQITKSSNYQIDLSSQPSGVYFYRAMGENGTMVGEGKFVLAK